MTTSGNNDLQKASELKEGFERIKSEIGKVIVGQADVIEKLLIAVLAKGHCLLIGVPGLAKTLMISTLAEVLDLKFSRIQFTPDLMPSDITGTDILDIKGGSGQREFRFLKGPIFANIVLADEINRTPPKTQSALLQAMQEYQVTAGNNTFPLEEPFFVLATQNPIELEGTYPLPEAQLDRFMFNIYVDYPNEEEEREIVKTTTSAFKAKLGVVFDAQSIKSLQSLVRRVPVSDKVIEYAVKLSRMTRPGDGAPDYINNWVTWGAGPRASQYLILGAKTRCLLDGRHNPAIEDIRAIAESVLRHRIVPSFNAEAEGVSVNDIIRNILKDLGE